MIKDFYVYLHRKLSGEIFYIGKGCGNRAWDKKNRSSYWYNTVKGCEYTVEIVLSGLMEWYAIELEMERIAYHGRKDLGYGSLVNQVDGGDKLGAGANNPMYGKGYLQAGPLNKMYGKKHSEAHKKVIAETTKLALQNPETRKKQSEYTKTHNPMSRPEIVEKHAAIMKSESFRNNMSALMSGANNPMYGRKGKDSPTFGRTGEKHPMFGRTGEKHPLFGKTGEKCWTFGKIVVNNGQVSKRVSVEEANVLINNGWVKGFIIKEKV